MVSASGINKVYDGLTTATVNLSTDKLSSDDVTPAYTAANFNNKNVGTGKAVSVSGISISGTDAGNYSFNTTASTTADITAKALVVSASGINKVYDGLTTATVNLSTDKLSSDDVTPAYTAANFNNKNVGTGKAVSVSGISISGTDAGNYSFNTTASTTADITAKALVVSASGINKVYDGLTTATVNLSTDKLSSDDVTPAYTAANFNNKNVGTGKAVSVSGISISGTDAGNYSFNTTASTTADITAKALVVSASGINKVYDGLTTATVNLSTDKLSSDDVTPAYTAANFNNKNVGTGKAVSVSGISISGTDAGNYSFNTTASTTADITAKALVVSASGINKVYDGLTTATVNLSTDKLSSDDVTPAYTAANFNNKNVGTGKAVSVSGISISGTDAGNYSFNTTASTTADITAKALVVSASGINKVYDGLTTATVNLSTDKLSSDDVTPAYTAANFNNKNVGTGKAVSVSGISISGTDAGNYSFNTTASTTADITAKALVVSASGINKVYDGLTTATVNLSTDKLSSDDVTPAYTAANFNNKNVGTGKAVSVSGISISGTDAGNYSFNTTASTTADITAKALVVSASGINKVYDGLTTATVNLSTDKLSSDDVTPAYTAANFNNKNVGTGKAVSVSGISISGTDAGNYSFNTTASTTADITAKALVVSASGINKVYDGLTTATVNLSTDKLSSDDVTPAYTAANFNNKNVGTGKAVSVSGISISGTDAGNYSFNTTASTTADITAKALVVSASGINKVYDGLTTATVNLSTDKLSSDDVTPAYTAANFNNKNVGTGKAVSVSGISISGTDAGNYSFNTTASTTADITAKALVVSASGINKVYDGLTTATVNLSTDKLSSDDVTPAYTAANFNNKNVGTGKAVSVSGISISGTDAGNYSFNTTASTTADITAKALVVSASGINKVYDGLTTATVNLSTDKLSSDDVTPAYTAANFNNKNVGTGKAVSVSGISISGTDAGNYSFNTTASTTADITAKALVVSASGINKVYDGLTTATVNLSTDKLSSDDVTPAYTAANFNNKNVGTGKAVSVSGISISGTDAGNYSFNTTASTTADITAKALVVSASGINKVYDGLTTATVNLSTDKLSSDDVTPAYTAANFNNKNVGTGKAVSVSGISISGTDAGNYSFNTTASTTADITAKALVVSASGINKVYDGLTTATVNLSTDKLSSDDVTPAYTAANFNNKNVGTGKAVSVSGISISGTDAGNYSFNTTASTTADITAKALVVSASGINKVYDGLTTATVNLSTDKLSSDDVTPAYTAANFNNKNVGTGKAVSVSGISISGTDAGNYSFNTTASTTADITAKALVVSASGINKVYDGLTTATVNLSTDKLSSDDVTPAYTAANFNNKNVGTGKAVSVSGISISGTDAGNYSFNTTASTTADITAKALVVSASGINKVYDGLTTATVNLSTDKLSSDDVTPAYTAANFNNKNVGTGKAVSVSGISISGTDAGNYSFNTTASTTADITAKALVVSASGINKVYDGLTTATVNLSTDKLSSDDVTPAYTAANFNNKNVGTGKAVSVSGISISGTDAGNYSFNTTASTTADITAKALVVSASGINKVYDGLTTATVNLSTDKLSSDDVTPAYTAANFNNKNVGTGKAVSVSGISISGTDAGNYSFNTTASTTADITAKALVVSASGINKVYDGLTTATVNLSTDKLSSDDVTPAYTAANFNNKNVGTGKAVSVSGISISGTDAGNYSFNTTASTTADITVRMLTVTAIAANKIYDGNVSATVTLSNNKVSGDNLAVTYTSASFNDPAVGVGKTVTVSGISVTGTDAGNYIFNTTATTTATIFAVPTVTLSTPNPVPINTEITITPTFGPDTYFVGWNYTPMGTVTVTPSSTQVKVKSSAPVVYSVSLQYKDGLGVIYTSPAVYAVFYDPNAGFVTGGGWITSPVVPALKYMQVSGKANFGFESKYEKGKTVPSGNTEFQFQEGGMNFKSSNYEWLVISGTRAQYKGTGTVNGSGNYGFLLTAIDGDLAAIKTTDKFRIKIWDINNAGAIVYDNNYLSDDNADPTTILGGGSIVIHEVKSTKPAAFVSKDQQVDATSVSKLGLQAYPNPAISQFTIKVTGNNTTEAITMIVYNQMGQVVDVKRNLTSGQTIQVGAAYTQGTYFVEVIQGDKRERLQVVKTN